MHLAELEFTILTYTTLEDNLTRHQGDPLNVDTLHIRVVCLEFPVE